MKRILIFVGLKVGEVAGFGFVYYLLCLLFSIIEPVIFPERELTQFWLGGFLLVILVVGAVLWTGILVYSVCKIIEANWNWAKRLSNRNKRIKSGRNYR